MGVAFLLISNPYSIRFEIKNNLCALFTIPPPTKYVSSHKESLKFLDHLAVGP